MKDEKVILETKRLILRHPLESDIEPLVALWCDPEVTRHLGGPRDQTAIRESLEQAVQSPFPEEYDLWAAVDRKSGKVVGHCGLLDKEIEGKTEIELVYVIAHAFWGKGYATEIAQALESYAFDELGLERLVALIEPENKVSEKVAAKVGMTYKNSVTRPSGQIRKLYVVTSPDPAG
ncbi:MAG TPA: GNAT family N-acetyltransferase [Spirochaetia bacterium]|nr:GNAT family N-acetyltransferase [Spirochaetia bacterium]